MRRPPTLRPWADATEPETGAVNRLRLRLTGPEITPLLRELATVDERAVNRLRARLRPRRRRSPSWIWVAAPLLVAASVLATVRSAPVGVLDEQLAATERTERALTPAVALAFRGSGTATGSFNAPRLHWDVGTLDVEVNPSAGVDLVVNTSEGTVRVVGTGFTVNRNALGTGVDVLHGAVAVVCGDGWSGTLHATESHVCLPLTASGWLLRVGALRDAGAGVDAILDAVARGLAVAPRADPVAAELLHAQVEVLLSAGRTSEALEAARVYPADGPRAADLARLLGSGREARP